MEKEENLYKFVSKSEEHLSKAFYDRCLVMRHSRKKPERLELLAIALCFEVTLEVYDFKEVQKMGIENPELHYLWEINPD